MDHTLALIGRIHQGDKEARDTLFSENMGLVYSVARRFLGRGVEMEDLFQIGSIGLLKAVDHFNPEFDVKFSTYAVPMIIGEIRRYMRDNNSIRVSRSLRDTAYKAIYAKENYMKKKDLILAGAVLLLAGILALALRLPKTENGNTMKVTVDGEVYGTYSLAENQTVKIQTGHGTNVLVIENGSVHMEEADCPDGYCKRQGTISRVNETIVCLPHKLVAEVESDGSTTDDADDAPDVIVK